jgi:hypothetical protein
VVVGEHGDEGVVVAIGYECEALAIGRPVQVAILATIEQQPFRFLLGVGGERRGPDLVVLDVGEFAGR